MNSAMEYEGPTPQRAEDFLRLEFHDTGSWKQRQKPFLVSGLIHVAVLILMMMPFSWHFFSQVLITPGAIQIRFSLPGEGPGGGGGGGGSGGQKPTAYIRVKPPLPKPPEPRRAPVAPRRIPPFRTDSLKVPDLPTDTALLFDQVPSPDAVEFPGLSLVDLRDYGGLDTEVSAGTGGGVGGGEGTGVGTGTGWGVGPGEGGGFGGGKYRPGGWDVDPVVVYKPPVPAYPPKARERMLTGEVILQIVVKLDGSTEVLGVIKSLPYCVEAAMENAKLWRWKPALKEGKPVEAMGIITVEFSLLGRDRRRS
ncbi:MAG: energy transducer TonB [Acidobacteriota bacterium]